MRAESENLLVHASFGYSVCGMCVTKFVTYAV